MTVNPLTDELIRKWPVPVARLMNLIVGWTSDYCYGGCGRPVTGRLYQEIETFEGTRIVGNICAVQGACSKVVLENPRNEVGESYADYRPIIIEQLLLQDEPGMVRLSFSR